MSLFFDDMSIGIDGGEITHGYTPFRLLWVKMFKQFKSFKTFGTTGTIGTVGTSLVYFAPSICFTRRSSKNCDGFAFLASGIVSDKKSKISWTPLSETMSSRRSRRG